MKKVICFFLLIVLSTISHSAEAYLTNSDKEEIKAISKKFIDCLKSKKRSKFEEVFLSYYEYKIIDPNHAYQDKKEYLKSLVEKNWTKLRNIKLKSSKIKFIRYSLSRKPRKLKKHNYSNSNDILIIRDPCIIFWNGGEIRKIEVNAFIKVGKNWRIFMR
ncbi:MAG: hypothetical protein JXA60_08185 [Candidatus Coatesbacteria bacterium]|nr:hypothetical protein [Candidatus Coatesbacteria bacterium]